MTPDYSDSPTIEARHAQAFPVLAPEEVDRLVRFGTLQQFADGSRLAMFSDCSAGRLKWMRSRWRRRASAAPKRSA